MVPSRQINNNSGNLLIFTLLLFSLLFFTAGESLLGQNHSSSALSTIVIDAGHGGKDPGAVVGRACEKDIVLDIARRLGRMIRQELPEVKVVYTRTGDYFVPLFKRSAIANKNNPGLFISIHANFCESSSVKGTETYVLGLHRTQDNLEVEKKENNVVLLEEDYSKRYEGFDPNSPVSNIMFELIQDNHIEQSVLFAEMVQDRFRQHAGRSDRDVRQAGFLVLRETAMPSVLVETGYLSNKAEAEYLMTSKGRETIASAIFNSVKTYKSRFDSRVNILTAEVKDTETVKESVKKISRQESIYTEKETVTTGKKISSLSTKKEPASEVKPVKTRLAGIKKDRNKRTLSQNNASEKETRQIISAENIHSNEKKNESSSKEINLIKKALKKEPDSNKNSNKVVSAKSASEKKASGADSNSSDPYTYAIQIAASKVKLSKSFYLFKGIQNIREINVGGYYKYYCFESESRKKTAENFALIKKQIPDAFLVGIKDGLPVPVTSIPPQHR